jgi:biotin carboxyl carrier protein
VLFHVEVNGRLREVSVEQHDGVFKVTVDAHPRLMTAVRADPATLSLIVLGEQVTSHEIGFSDPVTGDPVVYVDGVAVRAALATRRRTRGGTDTTGRPGVQHVKAPMPGKVVRVLVAAGDRVQPRQPVVVVEAMKMENELRAPKAGVVAHVAVETGASVDAGDTLLTID